MSYNVLRFVRACMLTGIASGTAVYFAGPVLAQTPTTPTVTGTGVATDPGVRGGPPGAGSALKGLKTTEVDFFNSARAIFMEVDSVLGTLPNEPGSGLGPRFNLNQCSGCHAQPDVGGTSPFTNPEIAVATLDGAKNRTNFPFLTQNGPAVEAHFVLNPDGTPDGGVQDLFVITGRSDAKGCNIVQPDFDAQLAANNIIFRIPTPTFGLGLVESTPDGDQNTAIGLVGQFNSQSGLKRNLGISGHFNRGDDGTINRFGWKAQLHSLLIFSAAAYNVEQGVTNEGFPNERDDTAGCQFNPLPEDSTNLVPTRNTRSPASDFSSDIVNFAGFMRLLAAPQPAAQNASASRGQTVFFNIGSGACHIQNQTTGQSTFTSLSNVTFQPFSDFAVHSMGTGLADRVAQGNAGGDQFRSAPLWGVGQRIFFLHDGRTTDLLQAIGQHASSGSEANAVINNFNTLSATDQQNLLNFLRSL